MREAFYQVKVNMLKAGYMGVKSYNVRWRVLAYYVSSSAAHVCGMLITLDLIIMRLAAVSACEYNRLLQGFTQYCEHLQEFFFHYHTMTAGTFKF